MHDKSKRTFVRYVLLSGAGIVASMSQIRLVAPGDGPKIAGKSVRFGMSEAHATCGAGMNCAGGGGQCGAGMNCAGGGGQCGAGMNCAGGGQENPRPPSGGGQCGAGMNCAGGGGQCGAGMNCAGGGGQCGAGMNCGGS